MLKFCRLFVVFGQTSTRYYSSKSSNKYRRIRRSSISLNSNGRHKEIDLFGPKDVRTPLPGNVGVVLEKNDEAYFNFNNKMMKLFHLEINDEKLKCLETESTNSEGHGNAFLECFAQKCPQLVIIDFQELFPARIFGNNLTLITFHDKWWSEFQVNQQSYRKYEAKSNFIELAGKICNKLREAGYWADFIDPTNSSIKSFTSSLFHLRDRYCNKGFTIEDTGNCKVVKHCDLKTDSFVGSLFTNASIDSNEVREILSKFKCSQLKNKM